ncbi:MAG TPA: HEAT repeat domain-containing protein [Tepidisphaeraceae bacterium]
MTGALPIILLLLVSTAAAQSTTASSTGVQSTTTQSTTRRYNPRDLHADPVYRMAIQDSRPPNHPPPFSNQIIGSRSIVSFDERRRTDAWSRVAPDAFERYPKYAVALLTHPNPDVRRDTMIHIRVELFRNLTPDLQAQLDPVVPELVQLVADPSTPPALRKGADLLAALHPPLDQLQSILELAQSGDFRDRQAAIKILTSSRDDGEALAQFLQPLLADPSERIRRLTIDGLRSRRMTTELRAVFRRLAMQPPDDVRKIALAALSDYSTRAGRIDPQDQQVFAASAQDPDAAIRQIAQKHVRPDVRPAPRISAAAPQPPKPPPAIVWSETLPASASDDDPPAITLISSVTRAILTALTIPAALAVLVYSLAPQVLKLLAPPVHQPGEAVKR